MKKTLLISILLFASFLVKGQLVSSFCTAPDSIKEMYVNDADRLTLRKIFRQELYYKDSIVIPQSHADTVLNALLAVYNATALAARDTVVTHFNIHSFPEPELKSFYIYANPTNSWMQELEAGNLPTVEPMINSLISRYALSNYYYQSYSFGDYVIFNSDSNYNLLPLLDSFNLVPGVINSAINNNGGDGNNIWDSIYSDRVELIYSLGMGDCPLGCTQRRFWKFNVYWDCSVEFVGSYGTVLQFADVKPVQKEDVKIYPNPFSKQLTIETESDDISTLVIYNLMSKKVMEFTFTKSVVVNTELFGNGIYFFELISDSKIVRKGKLVK